MIFFYFQKLLLYSDQNVYCKTVLRTLHPNHIDMMVRKKKIIKKILNTLIRADFNFNRSCKKKKKNE